MKINMYTGKQRFFHWMVVLCLTSLFSIVFVISTTIPAGLIVGKAHYSTSLFAVVLIVFCIGAVWSLQRITLFVNFIDLIVCLYTLYSIGHYFVSRSPHNDNFLPVLLGSLFYFLVKQCFCNAAYKDYQNIFIAGMLLASMLQAIYGLLQLSDVLSSGHQNFSLTGSFHNPGPYGIYLVAVLPLSIGVYMTKATRWLNYLSLATIVATVAIIPFTQSRTVWIACIVGVSCMLNHTYQFKSKLVRLITTNAQKGILGTVTIGLLIVTSVFVYQLKADSAFGRLVIWRVSLEMLQEKPLLGHGFGSFANKYGNYQAAYFARHPRDAMQITVADKAEYAFNDFLQLAIEQGLVGLVLFLVIFFSLICYPKTTSNPSFYVASISSVIAVMIAALFSYPFELIPIWFNLFFMLAVGAAQLSHKKYVFVISNLNRSLAAVIIISACVYVLYREIEIFKAKQTWLHANQLLASGDYVESIKEYRKIYPLLKENGSMLLDYGKALSLGGEFSKSIHIIQEAKPLASDPFMYITLGDNHKELGQYSAAEQAYTYATNMIPNRMYPKYLLVHLYKQSGDTAKVIRTAKHILQMQVKIASPVTEQMQSEMRHTVEKFE